MLENAKWIWLSKDLYPEYQETFRTQFADKTGYRFCVAGFEKTYKLNQKAVKAEIEAYGDTKFWLWLNNNFVGMGPVCSGGDYGSTDKMPIQYYNFYLPDLNSDTLSFYARVQLSPEVQADTSCGRGGFILSCKVTYEDGTVQEFTTDGDWSARLEPQFINASETDYTLLPHDWHKAEVIESVWNLKKSPIPMLTEESVQPLSFKPLTVKAGKEKQFSVEFDKIYSGYPLLDIRGDGEYEITIQTFETGRHYRSKETIKVNGPICHRTLRMYSVGGYTVTIINHSKNDVLINDASLVFTCYPVTQEGSFSCSDKALNKIYEVGKWTLQICRQTIELDSPLHQENLGCTGDYFIESLINYFTFGDTRLTRLDLIRTADYMRLSGGYMFHTSYSLIWVQMLYDYFQFTGEKSILNEVFAVLNILLDRFNGYVGETGVLETPPNYMFLDWVLIDGYTLHHPPKAIGQAALTAFYYKALTTAVKICELIGETEQKNIFEKRAADIKTAFNHCFYDAEKGLFISGLNTPSETNKWLPENPAKRYFGKHANTLAVLYDLCPKDLQKPIMEKVINDDTLIDAQPYFLHFVLEAIHKVGLFEKYGLQQIRRWKAAVDECDKGLKEAWGDDLGPGCDFSHAWGATPTYQLPSKLLGFQMLEPGFKKIAITPKLFGLHHAEISMPTPYGILRCEMTAGKKPAIHMPPGISIIIRS